MSERAIDHLSVHGTFDDVSPGTEPSANIERPKRRRLRRFVVGGVIGIVAVALVGYGGLYAVTASMLRAECDYEVLSESTSADGQYKATLLDPGCGGATNGFVTWVLVTPTDRLVDKKVDRVAVIDGKVESAAWGESGLVVSLGDSKVDHQTNSRWGAAVKYESAPQH